MAVGGCPSSEFSDLAILEPQLAGCREACGPGAVGRGLIPGNQASPRDRGFNP
jgi:hypothetical protein